MTALEKKNLESYALRLIRESTTDRPVWNVEKLRSGEKASWNYIDGCMIISLLELFDVTGNQEYFDFAERFVGRQIAEDGTIAGYEPEKYRLDDVNEGRVLFTLYEKTGKEKYRLAADRLRDQLLHQPRTFEYSFWHKEIYPDQVWLDGIYMAQVFAALYALRFGNGDTSDVLRQLRIVHTHMRDPKTGLYYHGYDASRKAFWADPETGLSKNFWLRSIGWFSAALADLSEILPEGEGRAEVRGILAELMTDIADFADEESGMYWQVVDQPGREGNYLETSGSAMVAYGMLKAARLGILEACYGELGRKTMNGILRKYVTFDEGKMELGGICLVAGLGPEKDRRRDGSYAYYISEPVVRNDAKGVAPDLMCFAEMLRTEA